MPNLSFGKWSSGGKVGKHYERRFKRLFSPDWLSHGLHYAFTTALWRRGKWGMKTDESKREREMTQRCFNWLNGRAARLGLWLLFAGEPICLIMVLKGAVAVAQSQTERFTGWRRVKTGHSILISCRHRCWL